MATKTQGNPGQWSQPPTSPRQTCANLAALVLVLALAAFFLHRAFGWPLAVGLPTWPEVAATLTGSELTPSVVRPLLGLVAWLVWSWLAVTLGVQLMLAALEVVTRGARWVLQARRLADAFTLPLVRRIAHGAVVTVAVAELATRAVPLASAAPPRAPAVPTHTPAHASVAAHAPTSPRAPAAQFAASSTYVVQPGDGLWTVAERCYGHGERWPEILAANIGRRMPDGQVFTRTPVLQPGWVLVIPNATARPAAPAMSATYVVRRGDTLSEIAERFYHDASLWPRIFQANQGAHLGRAFTLHDSNLIWPGLELTIPGVGPGVPAPPPSARPAPSPATAEVAPTTHPRPYAPILSDHDSHPPEVAPDQAPHAAPPEHAYPPAPTLAAWPTAPSVTPRPAGTHAALPHRSLAVEDALLAGGAALAAVGVVVVGRRVRWRRLGAPPEVVDPGTPLDDGYAPAELTSTVAHRLDAGEAEPAVEVAESVRRFLAEHGIEDAAVLTAEQPRRGGPVVLLRAGLAAQDRLLLLTETLGVALGGDAEVALTDERDIRVRPRRRHRLRVISTAPDNEAPLPLVPLAVRPDGATWYANWAEVGHVLIAGTPMGGSVVALTSLTAGLAARCHPRDLALWILARPHDLPAPLGQLPHQAIPIVDLGDADAVRATLAALGTELDRRFATGVVAPRLVVVVTELGELPADCEATLDRVARSGADCGVQLLAVTRRPEGLDAGRLGWFSSRLVMGIDDVELGVRLVGASWVSNGRGGHVAIQLVGRTAREAYAFRVADDQLRELVGLLAEAAGPRRSQPASPPPPAPDGGDAGPMPEEPTAGTPVAVVSAPASIEPIWADDPGPMPLEADTGVDVRAAPVVTVRCLGGFRVLCSGRALVSGTPLVGQKMWGVLAYLAAHPVAGVPKDRLLATLWPGEEEEAATKALRSTMTRLRTVLSEQRAEGRGDLLHLERDGTCRLEPRLVWSDVHAFLRACRDAERTTGEEAQARWEEARALYGGDLFADGAGAEVAWAEERSRGLSLREELRGEYFSATHRLALLRRRAGDLRAAAALYEAMLRLQPDFEDAARRLYQCYRDLGDRAAIVRAHRMLETVLSSEFQTEPEPETVRVYHAALATLDVTAASTAGVPELVDVGSE